LDGGGQIGLISGQSESRVKYARGSAGSFRRRCVSVSRNWFECLREHQQGRIHRLGAGALARGQCAGCPDRWIALDVIRPAAFERPRYRLRNRRKLRSLAFLSDPTPCGWSYANKRGRVARDDFFDAEPHSAATSERDDRRCPAFPWITRRADSISHLVRRHSQSATEGGEKLPNGLGRTSRKLLERTRA